KHDIARGHQGAAPDGKRLANPPHLAAIRRVPGHELALIVAGSACLRRVGADVRRAGDVAHWPALEVHAEIVRRHVEQSRLRREGGWLLILSTLQRWADVLDELSLLGGLARVDLR